MRMGAPSIAHVGRRDRGGAGVVCGVGERERDNESDHARRSGEVHSAPVGLGRSGWFGNAHQDVRDGRWGSPYRASSDFTRRGIDLPNTHRRKTGTARIRRRVLASPAFATNNE
jgi:hypothetical protein